MKSVFKLGAQNSKLRRKVQSTYPSSLRLNENVNEVNYHMTENT